MDLKHNADGTLTVPGGTYGTQAVDKLLHDLALARNQMTPAVPLKINAMDESTPVAMQDDPHLFVSRNVDGKISVGLRHQGFGWCIFYLTDLAAAYLRDSLSKRTRGIGVDLIQQDVPKGKQPKD